ncbi:MAG: M56 family metallopeptidase, partial [Bacillota bacterium]|nr:M56 family metallopeptidase [Bacillota bacterium]
MFFYTFMPGLFNMSLTASIAIVFVLLLRLLLKKTPKLIPYLLWAVVLFRLLCPVSIGSSLSLYNLFDTPAGEAGTTTSAIEYVPTDIVHQPDPAVALPLPGINEAINEILPQGEEQLRADPLEGPIFIITCIWMTGLLVMVLYSIVSYIRLLHKLSVVVPLRDNIFIADDIKSPFVVGLFSPKIYLPCNLTEKEQAYIILHEQHHIKRLDHITKALAFSALAIHWFNPLVWIAFILAGKDMEMSCDEAVIRKIGGDVRAEYSASLLTLATGRRIIAGTPLAFGEGDTKGRINNLSKWKKPALWGIVVAVLACAILAVCVLTNPLAELALGDIESVTADTISVSDEAAAELVSLINSHHCAPFLVGLDEPNSLSRAIQLNCANGDFYLLHYQYYSGLSFEPPHSGEDDFRSILTYFTSNGGAQKAWKMEYDFDAKLKEWLSKYSSPNFGAFLIDQPYGVMELTFESGSTSVAQVSTPEYMIDKIEQLFYNPFNDRMYPMWLRLDVTVLMPESTIFEIMQVCE